MKRHVLVISLLVSMMLGACGSAPQQRPTTPRPSPGARCDEQCRLRDDICRNKDSICRLSGTLDSDAWAQDRCGAARASCAEAERRCQSCNPGQV